MNQLSNELTKLKKFYEFSIFPVNMSQQNMMPTKHIP